MISRASAELRFAIPEVPRDAVNGAVCTATRNGDAGSKSPVMETVVAQDESAVATAVRRAFEQKQAVYPLGGGTSLDYGLPRREPGVVVSLAKLNRVLEHAADDLTITVEAGITLAELNRHLAAKGQWLPVDAPEPDRATVGGIVATNAFGPRRHGRGTIGDYLIGFRAIDGRGEAFRGGGKVVKNAAGYNLSRLMVGSRGMLGVITEATFMVRPVPACSALALCDVPSFEQAEKLLDALGRSQASPTIVELLAGPARANCPLPAMTGSAVARLALGFEGGAIEVPAMLAVLCEEWNSAGAEGVTTISGAGVGSIWSWLSASPALLQVNVLPSRLVGLAEQFAKLLPGHPMQAHAASGVIRVYSSAASAVEIDVDLVKLVNDSLRPLAISAGGHLTILQTPDACDLTAVDLWGPPPAGAALMRAIQQRFDPAGILNAGRF
jgi:glycolate oxidase FAD binding subunit